MTEKGQNFEIFRGKTYRIVIPVLDSNGAAFPLNGYSVIWSVYVPTTHQLIMQKTLGTGISVPTPANGEIYIDLLPSDTENFSLRSYNHECAIYLDANNEYVVSVGILSVLYSVP